MSFQKDDLKTQYEELWGGEYRERKRDFNGRYFRFMGAVNPEIGATIIDWGCGQGQLGKALFYDNCNVQMIDIASNSLDEGIKRSLCSEFIFINESITTAQPIPAHYSVCMDVLEHLEPKDVVPAISNIMEHTLREAYFLIALDSDRWIHGKKEYDLHLTLKSPEWWFKLFEKFGYISHRCLWESRENYSMLEVIIRL